MIKRLLRGRGLYIAFVILTVLLYGRTAHLGFSGGIEGLDALKEEKETDQLEGEWWPQSLDGASLQQLLIKKPHAAITLSILTVLTVGMMLGGIVFGIWALLSGHISSIWRFKSRRLTMWSFGELARVMILILAVVGFLPFVRMAIFAFYPMWPLDQNMWMTISMLFLDLFVILSVLFFAADKAKGIPKAFADQTRGISNPISIALRGYVAIFPWLLILLFAVVWIAHKLGLQPPIEPIHQLLFKENRPIVLGLTLLLACVVGPTAEEFFFRGVVYAAVRKRCSWVVAGLLSAAIFSAVHTNVIGFIPIMLLGFLLAYVYERTGSIISLIVIHTLHNTLLIAFAMVFRQLSAST